jgi:hypothetical protein
LQAIETIRQARSLLGWFDYRVVELTLVDGITAAQIARKLSPGTVSARLPSHMSHRFYTSLATLADAWFPSKRRSRHFARDESEPLVANAGLIQSEAIRAVHASLTFVR